MKEYKAMVRHCYAQQQERLLIAVRKTVLSFSFSLLNSIGNESLGTVYQLHYRVTNGR